MSNEYPYGKLDLQDAHHIVGGANSLRMALQEQSEAGARPFIHTRERYTG